MRKLILVALMVPWSASADEFCGPDIIRYGTHRETATSSVSNSEDEAMGQVYETPQPIVVTGIEAVMYFTEDGVCEPDSPQCVDGVGSFSARASVYDMGSDGFPDGAALQSEDVTLSCVCDVDDLDAIRYLIDLTPLNVTGDYAVVVQNRDSDARLRVVTNNYRTPDGQGDGDGENLGLYLFDPPGGGQELRWFRADNVSITSGQTYSADADVYVHPRVQFIYDPDFVPVSSDGDVCPNDGTTIEIEAPMPIFQHRMYNELVRDGNGDDASAWAFGDGDTGAGFGVSHTYRASDGFVVSRDVTWQGWTRQCSSSASYAFESETFWYFDCDDDGFTSDSGASFCGDAVGSPSQCDGSPAAGFDTTSGDDCDDAEPLTFPGTEDVCDGVDNDCDSATADGAAEPGVGEACDGADADACLGGAVECVGGALECTDDPADDDCDPDTEPDTDPDTEPDTDPGTDPDPGTDVDTDVDTGGEASVRCGCSAAPSSGGLGWLWLLGGVVWLRRRTG